MSHPTRGEWIEITVYDEKKEKGKTSHPTRGEWIEIIAASVPVFNSMVSPHPG